MLDNNKCTIYRICLRLCNLENMFDGKNKIEQRKTNKYKKTKNINKMGRDEFCNGIIIITYYICRKNYQWIGICNWQEKKTRWIDADQLFPHGGFVIQAIIPMSCWFWAECSCGTDLPAISDPFYWHDSQMRANKWIDTTRRMLFDCLSGDQNSETKMQFVCAQWLC